MLSIDSTALSYNAHDRPLRDYAGDVTARFAKVTIDKSWAFADKTRKDTSYLTHGYHRYPAKFIPQIVSRLEDKYSHENDLILDPFGGCGTTLVESKAKGRRSIGVDINPVAALIARVKTNIIEPEKICDQYEYVLEKLKSYSEDVKIDVPESERLDYWFQPRQKHKLAFLLQEINFLAETELREFFLCAFSNILKNCSIWHPKSNKPTRDFTKIPSDPFSAFAAQAKAMIKGNNYFYRHVKSLGRLGVSCEMHCRDARDIPTDDDSAHMVITSPPYVTSYEYADLHQLSSLWFEHTKDLADFRKRFIGTSNHETKIIAPHSKIANKIGADLQAIHNKTAIEVMTYFTEMNQVFEEMYRILKPNGTACIVIGNTRLKGVEILNAQVFAEQLLNLGFSLEDVIMREIPSKNLPSVRDEKTGKFASVSHSDKFTSYPTEYIVIARK